LEGRVPHYDPAIIDFHVVKAGQTIDELRHEAIVRIFGFDSEE
jgi:hypothetical protein